MATAGDRVQIVLGAKDELSDKLRATRRELTQLGRTANDMSRRMQAGEQGLQDEYEQTRQEMSRLTAEHKDLARQQSAVNREFRELTTSSRRAAGAYGVTNNKAEQLNRTTKSMSAGWGKMMGVIGGITAAVASAGFAFRFLGDSINEARAARKAMAQTAAVMRSMGRTEAPATINKMVNRLERLSGIDGDNLREMTNVLFTFGNVTGDTFIRANELALDLSVAFGKDLQSSAVMVGKALNDPIKGLTALSRIGVQFTQQQQDQIKAMMDVGDVAGAQKIILRELTRQVGGSAAAQADGIAKASVAWGNLKEAIGEVLMSTGTGFDLVGVLEDATKWIKQNKDVIVSTLQQIMSVTFKLISVWLKWQSIVLKGLGYIAGAIATTLRFMALIDPDFKKAADGAQNLADGLGTASQAANDASTFFDGLSTKAGKAAERTKLLADALEGVSSHRKLIRTMAEGFVGLGIGAPVVDGTRFAGGPVLAGNTYMVGEIGPELFVPKVGSPQMVGQRGPEIRDFHTSGTVIPSAMVGTYIAAQQASAAPAAGAPMPGVQIGELHVHDRFDARREFEAMMARQRRIAAERS